MTSTLNFNIKDVPPPVDTKMVNFFMGTNANGKHLEEALRQGIIAPGERLLGFFDGVFFDHEGKRVGGMALHDYLLVTDRHLILWARDQFKDYVDRFPLSHAFVRHSAPKDMLHGTVKFGLVLPHIADNAINEGEAIEITFDLVPLADFKQVCEVVEVGGNVHRDLIAGGASEADRWKATWVLFNQVFVGSGTVSELKPDSGPARSKTATFDEEPLFEIVEGAALDDLMTPLSRLDNLDGPARPRPARPAPSLRQSQTSTTRPKSSSTSTGYGAADGGGSTAELEAELRWLHGDPQTGYSASSTRPPKSGADRSSVGPGTRLKQDLNMNPENLYRVSRAGRAAWDGLDKFRREAEAKFEARGANVLPMLNTLKESGMNLKDITDFVVAINGLLDTVNRSPAARDIAMTFLSRSNFLSGLGGGGGGMMGGLGRTKPVPSVEEMDEDSPTSATDPTQPVSGKSAPRLKVERRGKPDAGAAQPFVDPFNPPRYKVAIRKHGSDSSDTKDEASLPDEAGETATPPLDEANSEPEMVELKVVEEAILPGPGDGNGSPLFKPRQRPVSLSVRVARRSEEMNN